MKIFEGAEKNFMSGRVSQLRDCSVNHLWESRGQLEIGARRLVCELRELFFAVKDPLKL